MNKIESAVYITKKWIFSFLATFLAFQSFSQEVTMQQTLDYINGKFAGKCSIDVSKGVLISVYQSGGQNVREDQVGMNYLDINSMKYDKEYNIFSINCKGAPSKKCVTRDLFVRKESNEYARVSWEVYLDEKGVNGMKKAMTHMIKLVLDSKYKSSEPFE
ncbi:MAG TPA: hypothetical protein VJY62_01270 [Bacteroidia bacterium]|nr:hypothetical protein [Bacteroidia bacterium]